MKHKRALLTALLLPALAALHAADAPKPSPTPTRADVAYGSRKRQVLDFWKAPSKGPTPLVFHIHGGGWVAGDKQDVYSHFQLRELLAAGVSVVSINYRFTQDAKNAGVEPPVQWPMKDAALALQFVRSNAKQWGFDKERVVVTGGSAGGCTALWLALHDDLSDPSSTNPILRESTKPQCAAVHIAQTSLDPKQMRQWTPNSYYGSHAFGFFDPTNLATRKDYFDEFLERRARILPWIQEYSPMEHVSPDDPPIYMSYRRPPSLGRPQKNPTHTSNFGVKLKEELDQSDVECHLVYPGAPEVKHANATKFLVEYLKP